MSKTLVALFVLLGCIAIPVVSVLIINTSFELVRSFYLSFYDSYLSTKYVAPVSVILTLIGTRPVKTTGKFQPAAGLAVLRRVLLRGASEARRRLISSISNCCGSKSPPHH